MKLKYLLLVTFNIQKSYSQGTCSNACPPINAGKEVPALCPGDIASTFANTSKLYEICHPSPSTQISFDDFKGNGRVTVIANYYVGCEAGLRESGVFAHVAQRFYNLYKTRTTFLQSVKGGGTCSQWANVAEQDAAELYPNSSSVVIKDMPLTINDVFYEIRDDLFTEPFKHPSYVILDEDLRVRHKFIGPCCGYSTYAACNATTVLTLDETLTQYIQELLDETTSTIENSDTSFETITEKEDSKCVIGNYSNWSPCSVKCGAQEGIQFRWRKIQNCPKPTIPVQKRTCLPKNTQCPQDDLCIPELGKSYNIKAISTDFDSPRDVAFHPTPGFHLTNYTEGRSFIHSNEEAWVINANNHSISIIVGLNTPNITTISRRDRGYYHYMINGTAIAFNSIKNSGRSNDRDSFNYWAICNDNNNTYLDKKEPNFFMGPTLYNSDPNDFNLVNKKGQICQKHEQCYFLHSDMLHESPACIGIAHDPELVTSYGNVYWAFDSIGNRESGQLVRFDFQAPHGPGSMDHSVAAVRRYVEIELDKGNNHATHAGMAVHASSRQLFIAVPGRNQILTIDADSGTFARSAREEYPIYSNRLPSFEYSIWECVDHGVFTSNVQNPSGLAISNERLFVAERNTGVIKVFEIATGALINEIETNLNSIAGMALSPITKQLYFVDENTNGLYKIEPNEECTQISTRLNQGFKSMLENAKSTLGSSFSLLRNYTCSTNPITPDSSYFEQVHDDTGYADADPNIQSEVAGMDESAALLANRTDCGYDSELNFDALLLGGYFCHVCLPEQELTCDSGGVCTNIQWRGYTCDNEYFIKLDDVGAYLESSQGVIIDDTNKISLKQGVTYRFTVVGEEEICMIVDSGQETTEKKICGDQGPLLTKIQGSVRSLKFTMFDSPIFEIYAESPEFQEQIQEETIVESDISTLSEIEKEHHDTTTKLSVGAIVGIAIASLVVLLSPVVYVLLRKKKSSSNTRNGHKQKIVENSDEGTSGRASDEEVSC